MCQHHKPATGAVCRSLHAEQNVCRWARPGDELYVMRFQKNGNLAMAKPCSECQKTIREAGIKKVWYTNRKGQWRKLCL